jgi:hypothetical protein
MHLPLFPYGGMVYERAITLALYHT